MAGAQKQSNGRNENPMLVLGGVEWGGDSAGQRKEENGQIGDEG